MLLYIKHNNFAIAFSNKITMAYRAKSPDAYQIYNRPIPPEVSSEQKTNQFLKNCRLFQQLTGIDLTLKRINKVRPYDGSFWDGKLSH